MPSLTEPELAELLGGLPTDAVHAIWLASGGQPATALALAAPDADAVVRRALDLPSRVAFLELDAGLIRLLEGVTIDDPILRARVLARLARELLADPSATARRRALADEAVDLARSTGDPGTIARVLDDRLHALWDPAAAEERLTVASEIVDRARAAGDAATELRGLFWRFTALAELADLEAAEAALVAYGRAGELAGDASSAVVVTARLAMLATVRGRFDEAAALIEEVRTRSAMADTDRLVASLNGQLAMLRGESAGQIATLRELARRLPGHFFEATAARALASSGRDDEAALELARLLPAVLRGSGPRWTGAAADLAFVAAQVGDIAAAGQLYQALIPYEGRLVVWGGANTITGPVDDLLGRLAALLGLTTDHFERAIAFERRIGALPWLASTLVARGSPDDRADAAWIAGRLGLAVRAGVDSAWRLVRDGDDWILEAGRENARLRDLRGLRYLRALLAAPGQEIAALDLVAEGAGLLAPAEEPVLDRRAQAEYRKRLAALDDELAAADRAGDADRSATAQTERTALLGELRRATGLGGRGRARSGEAERARVNATRTIRAALDRIAEAAPLAGAHLSAAIHTGHRLRYQPQPGGPARWQV
ncbi:hypothetical protein ACQPZX_17770 [Actinoplanes sp. CA-142083]|uniref:hypothetical protein n=1 Tax=Actinoplanes sp. CA-142083 TaxID=3239903 RepID=UPI003D923DC2